MGDLHTELFGDSSGNKRSSRKKAEKKLSYAIATFLRYQYPDVEYRFDIAADLKLTMGQANIVKNKLRHSRGWHDMMILEPRGGYFGMVIELKKDKSEVFKLDGTLKRKWNSRTQSDHNIEQFEHLERMRSRGYLAVYGFGFDDTVNKIRKYLSLDVTKCNITDNERFNTI